MENVFLVYQSWSDVERSQLERFEQCFPPPRFEFHCHCTDQDEPWCVLYDNTLDRILLHIARVGSKYVVAIDDQAATVHPSIKDAVRSALSRVHPPTSARGVA